MKLRPLMLALSGVLMVLPAFAADGDVKAEVTTAHGLDQFNQIEEIRFTFVVERTNGRTAREWEWRTDENIVTYREVRDGESTMITYDRDELDGASETVVAADRKFINDSFWLMWPLHASWAPDATVERVDENTIRLEYAATGGGYTPGDAYVIDLDEQGLATQWAFHRDGGDEPSLVNSFEDYVTVGPLTLATAHKNDSGFNLAFEDIAVRLQGEHEWKTAK